MSPISPSTNQLLLCLAADWSAQTGALQRFERLPNGGWAAFGAGVPVTLGRSGLAWGRGLHPAMPGLAKHEGDGRAPAGVFAITAVFGEEPAEGARASAARLPYCVASRDLKCVDDPASAHYNCLVDQAAIGAGIDWSSCESMLRDDARYELGAVVAHNAVVPQAGCGSCIFLHVWEAPGVPTAGCTAMSLADMSELFGWLDGAANPLLVQLPQAEYAALQADWGLPAGGGGDSRGRQG